MATKGSGQRGRALDTGGGRREQRLLPLLPVADRQFAERLGRPARIDRVDRIKQFLFQQEERLFQVRTLAQHGVHRLVDRLQTERAGSRSPIGIGQRQLDRSLRSWPVLVLVQRRPDRQLPCLLDQHRPRLAHRQSAVAEPVGDDLQRAEQFRRQIDIDCALSVLHFDLAGQHRLTVFQQIDEHRFDTASQRRQLHRLAARVDRLVRSHQEVAADGAATQLDIPPSDAAFGIRRLDGQADLGGLRHDLDLGDAQRTGLQLGRLAVNHDARLGRAAVGVVGDDVDRVGHALDQRAALGDHRHLDRIGGDDARRADRVLLAGRIGDRGGQQETGLAAVLLAPDQPRRQPERKLGSPRGIGSRVDRREHRRADLHRADFDLHRAVGHRFAEKVVGLQRAAHRVAGRVERLIKRHRHFEFRQHVFLDFDRHVAGRRTDRALDAVLALDDLAGQGAIGRRDAEPAGQVALLEDHVALGIGHRELDRIAGQRLQIRPLQGQRADVDRLARLIDRLVRADHQPPIAAQIDRAGQRFGLAVRLRHDAQLVAAVVPGGQFEPRRHGARRIGCHVGQFDFLPEALVEQTDPHGNAGHRSIGRRSQTATRKAAWLPDSSWLWPSSRTS
jgi:hypothetical protein